MPPMIPIVIFPTPCCWYSKTLNRTLEGKPPASITALDLNRSMVVFETFRTSTEYNAQVSAAAIRLRLPINNGDENFAVRGSITISTPRNETPSANIRRKVFFSLSRKGANKSTNAGVADVTSAPLEAVDNFVPTNWNPNEMPYPIIPTRKLFRNCCFVNFVLFRKRIIVPSVDTPKISLRLSRVKGGITSSTNLLTTYVPPQIDAAVSPLRRPL